MSAVHSGLRGRTRRPLAACIAALFALSATDTFATNYVVTTCADGFPAPAGSLREAVTHLALADLDSVDMSTLPTAHSCSVITLSAGEIPVLQKGLLLVGPPSGLTITAKPSSSLDNGRIFNHTGYGELTFLYLTISGGSLYSTTQYEYGGCIYSRGSVSLSDSTVENCRVNAKNLPVYGGGIFAGHDIHLYNSKVSHNSAGDVASSQARGGGVNLGGNLYMLNSTISNNVAGSAGVGVGGGVNGLGFIQLASSTVSGNTAGENFGGIFLNTALLQESSVIHNSTISGNTAISGIVGGMYSHNSVELSNSTIVFNTAGSGKRSYYHYDAPGLDVVSVFGATVHVDLQSSLLSNNTYQGLTNDFSEYSSSGSSIVASGANNLIGGTTVNGDLGVIAGRCPLLGPLRDNGGLTQTHALLSYSSAIDRGNNTAIDPATGQPSAFDERGNPFQRLNYGYADIGAYETQQQDIVFNTSFEGCLD
jgi:hypothetical protein